MKAIIASMLIVSAAACEICSDLQSLGIPVRSADMQDSMLVVTMSGSLAEGDSLLKHYGGVFFASMDSIIAGWDVFGIAIELDEATLVFLRSDMVQLLEWISENTDDDAIAEWVLNHTRVIRLQDQD